MLPQREARFHILSTRMKTKHYFAAPLSRDQKWNPTDLIMSRSCGNKIMGTGCMEPNEDGLASLYKCLIPHPCCQ